MEDSLALAGNIIRSWHPWRFTLRAMFAVMTVACVWLGWHTSTVNQRKQVRAWVVERGGWFNYEGSIWTLEQRQKDAELSWIRQALGDQAAVCIELPPGSVTRDEINHIEAAFPEATVCIGAPDGPAVVAPPREDGIQLHNWPPKPAPAYY